jgi:hypothetical protein
MNFGGPSAIAPWEACVNAALEKSLRYFRVHTAAPECWSLHCPDHGDRWQHALKNIIERVEAGEAPGGQAGRYDLILDEWLHRAPAVFTEVVSGAESTLARTAGL